MNTNHNYNQPLSLAWSHPRWSPSEEDPKSYQPQTTGNAPRKLRIGELKRVEKLPQTTSPAQPSRVRSNFRKNEPKPDIITASAALVPIRYSRTLQGDIYPGNIVMFSNSETTRKAVTNAIESMALRTICTFPVRQLRCTFIDPIDMGKIFPFAKLPELIVGDKVYTSSSDIREQLQILNTHVEAIIQNRLGKDYQTIEEFNQDNSVIAEPYRYLFIADFPNGFDSNSIEIIKSLLRNAAKAGVYLVIHLDEKIEKPRDLNYDLFRRYSTTIQPQGILGDGTPLFTSSSLKREFRILLDVPPAKEQFNQLTSIISKVFKEFKPQSFPFTDFYPDLHLAWSEKYDSRQQIRTPIGLLGAEGQLEFWLGEDENEEGHEINVSQGLLAGKPGSGKSFTLHAIILGLAMRYAPDELEMYLLDYKDGVEFQIYVNPEPSIYDDNYELDDYDKALPHAKVISIASDREFGLNVLKYICNEIKQRSDKFKEIGAEKIAAYRQLTEEKMPRIFVVIDEFQALFKDNDRIMREINEVLDDPILRKGRSYGVHLLLASQIPNDPNMNRTLSTLIELRMAMEMDTSIASSILSDGNSNAVELLDRPGKIIYNSGLGRKEHNQIGQVANVSPDERINALKYIHKIAKNKCFKRTNSLFVFKGLEPGKLKNNNQLNKLFEGESFVSSQAIKSLLQETDWIIQESPAVAWLGEAMNIGNHTRAIFRNRPRSNMIIVGSSEEMIWGLLGGIFLSLVNCYQPQQAQFNVISLYSDEYIKVMTTFRDSFKPYFPIALGKQSSESEHEILKAETLLQKTFEEFETRNQKRLDNPDEIDLGPSLFLVYAVGALSKASNLRPVEGRRGEDSSEDAKKLLNLLSKGPELGIHVILTLDSMRSFVSLSADNRSWLSHFDLRVALKMPPDDSRLLLGESYAQNLAPSMAYFLDRAIATEPEKFKPYAVPSVEEMIYYGNKLTQRIH